MESTSTTAQVAVKHSLGTPVPIANLDPAALIPTTCSIEAVVTLMWPFSSHSGTMALLLADPDFRLRSRKGQVRVQFMGSPAKQVAMASIGIGDRVTLSLRGASWAPLSTRVTTPGSGVGADLIYRHRLLMQAAEDENEKKITIECDSSDYAPPHVLLPPTSGQNSSSLVTPIRTRVKAEHEKPWSSPRFSLGSSGGSASLLSRSQEGPLPDETFPLGRGRKRPASEGSSRRWRFVPATDAAGDIAPASRDATPVSSEGDDEEVLDKDQSLSFLHVPQAAVSPLFSSSPLSWGVDSSPTRLKSNAPGAVELSDLISLSHQPSPALPSLSPSHHHENPLTLTSTSSSSKMALASSSQHVAHLNLTQTPPILENDRAFTWQAEGLQGRQLGLPNASSLGVAEENETAESLRAVHNFGLDGSVPELEVPKSYAESSSIRSESNTLVPGALDGGATVRFPGLDTQNLFGFGAESVQPERQALGLAPAAIDHQPSSDEQVNPAARPPVKDLFEEFLVSSPLQDGSSAPVTSSKISHHGVTSLTDSTRDEFSGSFGAQPAIITPNESQETQRADVDSSLHPVDQILNGRLPMTPKRTNSALSDMITAHRVSPPAETLSADALPTHPLEHQQFRPSQEHTKDVPIAVSPWFSSKRSTLRSDKISKPATSGQSSSLDPSSRDGQSVGQSQVKHLQSDPREAATKLSSGLRTSLSYYVPLGSLDTYLTASSSQGSVTIDNFSVVTSRSSQPLRAKKGPKDYSTVFKISDMSRYPLTTQVQCLRPFQRSLPEAAPGDVVLLRDFVVRARDGQCILLSADSSAWHVWRYPGGKAVDGHEKLDTVTSNAADVPSSNGQENVREECRGPPVELADEERAHAARLRCWWQKMQTNGTRLEI